MSESLPNSQVEELSELAAELSKGIPALAAASGGLEEMDYEDMSWVPDPVDAGPEFRRSKGLDVVGSLFSLYESKEVWIKEVQTILSARLLQDGEYDFEKEVRTVELLKLRFGDSATQSADIMLKDVSDSKRVDAVIREVQRLLPRNNVATDFHAKILSRLYWPQIKQETFIPPQPIQHIMTSYQQGFEQLKKKRKIDWMMTVGRVEIELELEDRMVVIPDATPAQAAVIYAFNDNDQDEEDDEPKAMAYEQLLQELNMSEETLHTALSFWIEKEVLVQLSPRVFTVLETLDSTPGTPRLHEQQQHNEEVDRIEEERTRERAVIEQFVIGMLTNGGAMPTERISMMLGMLVPGGFRWSVEELGEFLLEMKENRKIETTGQGWRVV
jgi:anaphase-promoting complex subunit 2